MKKAIFFLILILTASMVFAVMVRPMYVANPTTLACKYYFAGDERHFNPRPDGYTIDVAFVQELGKNKNVCEEWKECMKSSGEWKFDVGCKKLNLFERIIHFFISLFS